ncbi:trypsin-like serine protease [Vibrio ziniensis]|uniref:Trypsin-like serine protease n=1 Tax=Vibrio ziniensis TaxID=2711221 RepID=A0A6G7CHB6_9VIBR|nr:trypsin-like serine protease [Vibrio ziniensis]QIH41463.1 trypsin-like serine protease [Vibrio ziniensis]
MKFKKSFSCLFFSILSSNVVAVEYGTAVTEAQYEAMNYVVNIATEQGTCGAQLIAGQWLITARHCTPSWDADDSGVKSDDLAVTGDTFNIVVYQGVGGALGFYNDISSRVVYQGSAELYTMGAKEEALAVMETIWEESGIETKLTSIFNYGSISTGTIVEVPYTYSEVGVSFSDVTYSDLALIKLSNPIAYQSTLKLGVISDLTELSKSVPSSMVGIDEWSNSQNINVDQSFTFFGWGRNENSETVYQMHYGTQTVTKVPMNVSCSYYVELVVDGWPEYSRYDCKQEAYDEFTSLEGFSSYLPNLSVSLQTWLKAAGDDGMSGDSGTAVLLDNTMYGVVSSGAYGLSTSYQSLESQMDWILGQINALNVPTKMEFLNSDNVTTFDVEVQNLSKTEEALDIAVSDSNVTLDTSDCPETLGSLESCKVTVTIGDDADVSEFTIQFNQQTNTTVSFVEKYTGQTWDDLYGGDDDSTDDGDSDDSDDDTDTDNGGDTDNGDSGDDTAGDSGSSAGGSSGGSTGTLSVLALFAACVLRRKAQKA